MEECNSRIAGRSAMAPSKNSSSIDRRSRNCGEHRTGEFPNSSFRGVDSGQVRYHRTVDRPDRGEDRRRPVDSRGVSKRRGDREGSSNKRPTLTADDRTVMNGIDAILVVRKKAIHGFPMIRAVVVIVTIPMMTILGRRTTVLGRR